MDGKKRYARHSPALRFKVKQLIAEGLSLNVIARQTGVNVGVVSLVRRGLYWQNDDDPIEEVLSSGDKGRCAKCGAMVWLPCVACNIEQKERNNHARKV